jgi:diketogulonate reductase-like aldo/keto reductase
MKYATLPDGEQIPVIGLGTWSFGGGMSSNRSHDRETVATLRYALELGYSHLDTAEIYGGGHTEELIGQALQGLDRGQLFITTKVSPSHLRYQDILTSLENSLKRLQTGYMDLYLIHWPSGRIPLEESFRALNEAVQRGLVRFLGVSNFSLRELQEAEKLSETPLATNQVPFSLANRRYAENGVLAYCQERGILLTAYSPLKGGVLRNRALQAVARRHRLAPAQVALHWLVRQPGVITIPQSASRLHLRENLEAADLDLPPEDMRELMG